MNMKITEKIIDQINKDDAYVINVATYDNGQYDFSQLRSTAGQLNCYSISKNFTATAVGIARDNGLLDVDTKLSEIFDDVKLGGGYADMTVHHLLTHTTGIEKGYLFEGDRYEIQNKDWLEYCLNYPLIHKPGEVFSYSNSTYYLLSCIIQRVTGKRLDLYLREKMFGKLEINSYAWESCPMDRTMGATGLFLHTTDLIKLGVMYLNGGQGIVSEDWVKLAASCKYDSPNPNYAYSFGVYEHGFTCSGAAGQSIVVLPEHNFVFAAHGCNNNYDYYGMIKKVFSL